MSSWQASTAVGIFLGAQIPSSWSLDFSLALTFIALVVPTLKDRAIPQPHWLPELWLLPQLAYRSS
jgi:predicted branched-subunit amino acid permease